MARRTAAIAGGGIGGLASALALARENFQVDLFERRNAPSEEGAGIQLGPNATRVLKRLGVLEDLRPKAVAPMGIDIFDARRGTTIGTLPLGDHALTSFGAPYLTVHRRDLHNALLSACGEISDIVFHYGSGVERLVGPPGLRFKLSDGGELAADLLIGADGVSSTIATSAVFGRPPISRSDVKQSVAFRAMLPRAGLPDVYSFSRVGLWLSDRVHVVHYPVGSGDLLNVVIVTDQLERHLTAEDDPWRIAITQSDVRDALFGSVPVLQDLAMLAADWGGWVLHDDTAPLRMSSGICALVGDAAHPILPYQAQGAAMALEDAEALALCVGDPEQLIETGLKSYQELRHSRTKRVASVSRRNKSIYNLSGPMALARNAVLKLAPGAAIMQQFSWLYGYDVMNEIE